MKTLSKRLAIGPLFVLLALAGCGAEKEGAAPVDGSFIARAASLTSESGSSEMSLTMKFSGADGALSSIASTGAFDFARRVGKMTMDLSSLGLPEGSGNFEMRLVQDEIYVQFPGLAEQFDGRQWARINLKEIGKQTGVDLQQLSQFQNSDPTASLAYLKAASGKIELLGADTVRGVSSKHYRFIVDFDKAATSPEIPAPLRDTYRQAKTLLGISSLPMEAWIDAQDRIRRMSFTMDLSKVASKQPQPVSGTATQTIEFFNFGVKVDVEPPLPNEVVDYAEVLEAIGRD